MVSYDVIGAKRGFKQVEIAHISVNSYCDKLVNM